MKRVGLAVVVLAAMLGTARAQTVQEGCDAKGDESTRVMDLEGCRIGDDAGRPPGTFITGKYKPHFSPLFKLRAHFNPELQKSQDQL